MRIIWGRVDVGGVSDPHDEMAPDLTLDCLHDWEFYSCGIDADALSGRGPQRCNFRCRKCGAGCRREILRLRYPITPKVDIRPDMSKPVYSEWRQFGPGVGR